MTDNVMGWIALGLCGVHAIGAFIYFWWLDRRIEKQYREAEERWYGS